MTTAELAAAPALAVAPAAASIVPGCAGHPGLPTTGSVSSP